MSDQQETIDDESSPLLVSNFHAVPTNNRSLYLVSLAMLLGAVCTGLMLGLSSPLIAGIEHDNSANAIKIDTAEQSWIGSILTLGGVLGGPIAGVLMQSLGRKPSAILSAIPYIAGLLLISYASNVWMIYAGRFITGIAMSITTLIVPTYISEVSTQGLRGFLCSGNQQFITIGIFIVYGLGGLLPWRWLEIAIGVFPFLYCTITLFIPETPRYLLLKNKGDEAERSLRMLRGKHADIDDELAELEAAIESITESASWKEILLTPSLRIPLLLSLVSMFFQQFSGINCIMFYAQGIFEDAGFKSQSQILMSLLLIAGIQVIFTAIASTLVDRLGRKVLLTVSSFFMAVSIATLGAYFQLNDPNEPGELSWLALSSLIVYIATFSLGLGPVPWILMSELLPVRARGKCGGLVTAFNLLSAFVITKEFQDLQNAITPQGAFWCFSGICILSIVFTHIFLPETRGRSLEEIARHFEEKNNSPQYDRNGGGLAATVKA